MLIDVVNYGGERDLLLARLDYLQADRTIVVEGNRQFQGQHKGWSFIEQDVWSQVEDYADRLIYYPIESSTDSNAWNNEWHQRNAGLIAVQGLGLPDDAIVGFFDVDEFPDRDLIRETPEVSTWHMAKYQMSLFWYQRHEVTGVSGKWADIRGRSPQDWRGARSTLTPIQGGFHFSSFGTVEETLAKWTGFSHTELKRADMEQWIENGWVHGKALESGDVLPERAELDSALPEYMLNGNGPAHWYRRRPTS